MQKKTKQGNIMYFNVQSNNRGWEGIYSLMNVNNAVAQFSADLWDMHQWILDNPELYFQKVNE